MSTQETAQIEANMSVVHNILAGSDELVAPVSQLQMAAQSQYPKKVWEDYVLYNTGTLKNTLARKSKENCMLYYYKYSRVTNLMVEHQLSLVLYYRRKLSIEKLYNV